jgi:hypothetical protein
LDGYDITDPVTGRYTTALAVEGVHSLDLESARQPAQYGRGSAGSLNIQSDNGTDQFHYTATNFIPGLDTKVGFRIGDWTPRAGFFWAARERPRVVLRQLQRRIQQRVYLGAADWPEHEPDLDRRRPVSQVNLTPANILHADLLTDFDHRAHFGLGVLDPVSTTQGVSDHQWLAGVKDSHTWFGGAMLEAGFAWQSVYHRSVPEGSLPYLVTPNGRSGNYFVDALQNGRRDQAFVNYFLRARRFFGRQQLAAGGDAQRLDYSARFVRTVYETIGLNGLPAFSTTFRGTGVFDLPNAVAAGYVSDLAADGEHHGRCGLARRLGRARAQLGAFCACRAFLGTRRRAPHTAECRFRRAARRHQPGAAGTACRSAGRQHAVRFRRAAARSAGDDVRAGSRSEIAALRAVERGRRARFRPRHLRPRRVDAKARRRRILCALGGGGAINLQPAGLAYGFGGTYALTNQRHDAYDELAFTVRQSFGDQFGWLASYTRLRDVSNTGLDVNIDQPLQVMNNFGRMPWDAPSRFLGWAYLPTPWKNWAVAFLLDYRTGFPSPSPMKGASSSGRSMRTATLTISI